MTSINVTEIPFVKLIGIQKDENGDFRLPFTESMRNHLDTIHAGAQFTLAETASGDHLQAMFPELAGKVIPLLRDAQIKFKKPAMSPVMAFPSIDPDLLPEIREELARKGRTTIQVEVEIKDLEGVVTCTGTFKWFVQAINHES